MQLSRNIQKKKKINHTYYETTIFLIKIILGCIVVDYAIA